MMHQAMYVSLDGRCVPERRARVSVLSRVFQYGDGLFETLRVCNGAPFRLSAHIERLAAGLQSIGCTLPLTREQIRTAINELLSRNRLSDAALKITAFRDGGERLDPDPAATIHVVMTARPFDHDRLRRVGRGISARIVTLRRNCLSPLPTLKSLNYLENIIARREARAHGSDEALFLNVRGMLAEGATSNLFLVRGGTLITPPLSAGILNGVTRRLVFELAEARGIPYREADISRNDLMRADEAFCTNALMGIMPLRRVDGTMIGTGSVGSVTRRLRRSLNACIRSETT